MPVVIVENDKSQWKDETGSTHHFPKRNPSWLLQGTELIYYKGRIEDITIASAGLCTGQPQTMQTFEVTLDQLLKKSWMLAQNMPHGASEIQVSEIGELLRAQA